MSSTLFDTAIKPRVSSSGKIESVPEVQMKRWNMAIMLLVLLAGPPPGEITIGETAVSAEHMIHVLEKADIVFVGEKHDDPLAHRWEQYIWEAMAKDDRVLALEMFETDVQEHLDDYLEGEITREEFLESSRPWSNYEEDYEPMVRLAMERGIRVIAANVPRRHAASVARAGWSGLDDELFFKSVRIDSSNSGYRDRFMATMEEIGDQMHAMPMEPEDIYRAQLLKDAVMAKSIQGLRCVFVCGSFHSDFRSGIPDQLPPGVSYLTVKILAEGEEYSPELADFVILRPSEE